MQVSAVISLFLSTALAYEVLPVSASSSSSSSVSIVPDLPLGEINVVVLTDVHSWVSGHGRQEPKLSADYGDVLSFYENLKQYCDDNDQDLWFVSNGDFVDGTGLSVPGDPSSLIPVLQKMPLDALTCGNHELYIEDNVDYMVRPGGWADWWGEKYLTGNIQVSYNGGTQQLGRLYRYLKGRHSNLLVYGFLYNMEGTCESITVEKVYDVVKLPWFKHALTQSDEPVDAVLVLAHMDLKDPSVEVVRKAIREIVGDSMPIQFITGHTHYRGETGLDDWSRSFEAGRYLDTVGFVSFPTRTKAMTASDKEMVGGNGFKHVFMNANKEVLAGHLGLDPEDMDTEHGLELSEFARSTRQKMGLLDQIGCAPHDFKARAPIHDPKSLWGLYKNEVLPTTFFSDKIMFVENEAWRYDLFSHSPLVVDDIIAVAPFNDTIVYIGQVLGSAILQLNVTMNHRKGSLPHYILAGEIDDKEKLYEFYTHDFNVKEVVNALHKMVPNKDFEPKDTLFTSTKIWVDFVQESWPCEGQTLLPKSAIWIPTSNKLSESIFEGDDGVMTKRSSPILFFLMMLLLLMAMLMCGIFFRTKSTSLEYLPVDLEDVVETSADNLVAG